MWLLNDRQLANMTPKIKSTIKWLKHSGYCQPLDLYFEINLKFNSNFDEWWLHINGRGAGATYTIGKDKKRWKLI